MMFHGILLGAVVAAGAFGADVRPASAQSASVGKSLSFVQPSGNAPAARPATLPENDDFVIPAMTPERMKMLAAKQKYFPLSAGTALSGVPQKSGTGEKIVGGTKAAEGAYPFQVGLLKVKREKDGSARPLAQFCGGSLLTERWVLTAAHCFVRGEKGKIASIDDVREIAAHVGGNNLVGKADRILAKRIVIHPKYVPGTSVNDIAMVELERPPSAEAVNVGQVTVITKDTEAEILPVNAELTIIGWGMTEAKKSSMDLLETKVTAVDRGACNRVLTTARMKGSDIDQALSDLAFTMNISPASRKSLEQNLVQFGGTVTAQMICAAAPVDGHDTCPGDSGGPILRKYPNGKMVQVGIVSFGIGECGVAAMPGVYTRLSLYTDWMTQVVESSKAAPAASASKPAGGKPK
jgi:secreted trypsin-like serine protease